MRVGCLHLSKLKYEASRLIGVLVACLTSFVVFADERDVIPNGWGHVDLQRVENSECPLVEGKYDAERVERVRKVERGAIDDPGPNAWRMLFRHPRIRDKTVKSESVFQTAVKSHYLQISQPSPDEFQIHRTFIDGKGIVTYRFDRRLDDFSCRDGFIILKPIVTDQTGHYSKNTSQFTRTQDGSLVCYERIETDKREMIFLSSSGLAHQWYRFSRVSE